jgi:hypothetical protein
MGAVVIRCPDTGHQISTGLEADAASFREMPVFFGLTYCPICRTHHQWFARDAWVVEQVPDRNQRCNTRQQPTDEASKRPWVKLAEFVHVTNIERYRRMLNESTEDRERRTILKLLSEEMGRQKNSLFTDANAKY